MRVLHDGRIFVSYGQAMLFSESDNWPDFEEARAGQLNGLFRAARPGTAILVTGTHTGFVLFRVEWHDHEPALPSPQWADVVEVSFEPQSDRILLMGLMGDDPSWLPLDHPGPWRIRYCAQQFAGGQEGALAADGETAADSYLLQLWPAPPAPDAIVRVSGPGARHWHDAVADPSPTAPAQAVPESAAPGHGWFADDQEHSTTRTVLVPKLADSTGSGIVVPVSGRALSGSTRATLNRIAIEKQVSDRVPGLAAGVARRVSLLWHTGVGTADLDRPFEEPDPTTQFDIASITKSFVAVTVMALRDAGKLSLDDPVERHLPASAHVGLTIRQLLAHVSGMQREPVGDVWDTLVFPHREDLLAGWNDAERIGIPHSLHHYSNLGFAILGEIIARAEGMDWYDAVRRRVLDPLGLINTTLGRGAHASQAGRYYVPPWTDVPVTEPEVDLRAFAPAGGFASTLDDLATWGGFLARPVSEVLSPDTVEEMCQPMVTADAEWAMAWGLGLMLLRHEGRVWVGHSGGFPGTVSGCFTHRESATTGIVLMNQSNAGDPASFAARLGSYVLEHDPELPQPWRPGTSVPEELAPLLGQWFSEGREFVFSVREGRLEARLRSAPMGASPSVFELIEPGRYRTVAGRERGELLRLDRGADGSLVMHWATYRFTREPVAFGQWR